LPRYRSSVRTTPYEERVAPKSLTSLKTFPLYIIKIAIKISSVVICKITIPFCLPRYRSSVRTTPYEERVAAKSLTSLKTFSLYIIKIAIKISSVAILKIAIPFCLPRYRSSVRTTPYEERVAPKSLTSLKTFPLYIIKIAIKISSVAILKIAIPFCLPRYRSSVRTTPYEERVAAKSLTSLKNFPFKHQNSNKISSVAILKIAIPFFCQGIGNQFERELTAA
jgi:hypothetical protein